LADTARLLRKTLGLAAGKLEWGDTSAFHQSASASPAKRSASWTRWWLTR
jgi:hypothetical protein